MTEGEQQEGKGRFKESSRDGLETVEAEMKMLTGSEHDGVREAEMV